MELLMERKNPEEMSWSDIKTILAENAIGMQELRESQKETDRLMQENDKFIREKLDRLEENIGGVSNSNGSVAEEYFYNSLGQNMEFAGIHFNMLSNNLDPFGRKITLPNGEVLQDEFDIVMVNGNSIALIEVKYKAKDSDVKKIAEKKAKNFRLLYPEYKDFKIYLGLGSFSFDKYVVNKAKELGIGLLKQVGKTMEYENMEVKAY
jgi:hypothetical protein